MQLSKKVLLLYISDLSGHHHAAMAVEKAIKFLNPAYQVRTLNSFNYTNPILEKIINHTYMGIIKRTPEVWEYLYDNPKIVRNAQRLKDMIHRYNSSKMKTLIEDFKPDVIACTQAFPCGMVADYKTTFHSSVPLVGILTDFYPHSYWIYEAVDRYVVASEEARSKMIENGVPLRKMCVFGIPVDISFRQALDRDRVRERLKIEKGLTTILIMGGSGGLGPIKRIVLSLDKIKHQIQMIIVTGVNQRLYSYLNHHKKNFKKNVAVLSYSHNINELMSVSDIIITKPGGLTVSEALARSLPIIIIHPIPGQEAKNTQFLLYKKAAVKADNEEEVAILIESLCSAPSKLDAMKKQAALLGRPNSSIDIATMVSEFC